MEYDVKKEKVTIEKCNPKDYALCVNKLRKQYPKDKIAVKEISFGLK
jgi:hypothetical protein